VIGAVTSFDARDREVGMPADADTKTKSNTPRNYPGGPIKLNARMLRMIDLMVNGHPDDPSRTQYGLYDAAAAVGYYRRAARALAQSPLFVRAYNAARAGRNIQPSCPTLEQVREILAKQNGARLYARHKAGRIVRVPAQEAGHADAAS
jgi:hypothetical protein